MQYMSLEGSIIYAVCFLFWASRSSLLPRAHLHASHANMQERVWWLRQTRRRTWQKVWGARAPGAPPVPTPMETIGTDMHVLVQIHVYTKHTQTMHIRIYMWYIGIWCIHSSTFNLCGLFYANHDREKRTDSRSITYMHAYTSVSRWDEHLLCVTWAQQLSCLSSSVVEQHK